MNDLSKSNQRAHSFLISKEICRWWTRLYRPIRDGFFRILPEVSVPWGWPKGSKPLGTRLKTCMSNIKLKKGYICLRLQASKCEILHPLTWKGRQAILSQPKFLRYILDNQILLSTVICCLRFYWNQCVWSTKLSHWALLPEFASVIWRRLQENKTNCFFFFSQKYSYS